MTARQWQQITITFIDQRTAYATAVEHLAPILAEAEARGVITAWFYVRKGAWRLRYLPADDSTATARYVTDELERLTQRRLIHSAVAGIYEPETHAFGGPDGMDIAHQLWHHDSRHLLTHTADHAPHQREQSVLLCAAMIRAAGLDWYEHGDVWARVADHRDPPATARITARVTALNDAVRRLLTVDPATLTGPGMPMAHCRHVVEAYAGGGAQLRQLDQSGRLHRGLRAVLAHHVIFAWNRRSIPGLHQAAIATAAKTVIFGPDPATGPTIGTSPQ